MLNEKNIKSFIASGEGYNIEFKVSIPSKIKDVTEEICAFANAAGGTLLLGVNDNNVVQGVTFNNAKRSALQNSINEISPALHCKIYTVTVDSKDVVVIEVPSGENKPYVLSGAIYVRQGPNSQKLTTVEEMRDFFQQADKIYFDEAPCKAIDIDQDVPDNNINQFRVLAGLGATVSNEQVFNNLKLITKEGFLKNGATLFFAENPEHFFEKAVIRCIAFDGIYKRFIEDDKIMIGSLYNQYLQAMSWLKKKLDVRYDIEGEGSQPRKEIWEIPETVFKEAIINALAHRDYYDKGARITIEVFNDRVEISNPGGLISGIPKNEFGKRSLSRNPLIFGLFERIRMVEQVGSGIGRMRDLMIEADLTEPEFNTEGMFTVTVRRPFDFNKWVDKWVDNLTDNRVNIIKAIHENSKVSKRELEDKVGLSATAIDNNLDALKDLGLIERVGSAKGGHWQINYILP
ncbi:RNA-binding domain-containing protein [Mesonia mobilis]|uniref:ArsR family transcriptional regulator n=1 Tax=Mesonia mobilis TaxID=369791 RepID=A0ABQ3BK75_9FLAO|nr:RNA-binding domain-containing protein [Mesonia mobilis]MBQ0738383.1 putative DNA binding domain-containing protein [Aquimarina celericrescens]GGZ48855.1 ArsR family transcriptional regulator [Mesonia mobilis]